MKKFFTTLFAMTVAVTFGIVAFSGNASAACIDITDKKICNADPNCEWIGNPRTGSCQDIGCTITEDPEVSCTDGVDNDCDGLTDSADPDCQQCTITENPEVTCTDGVDNDCDGLTDCADTADCGSDPACQTSCTPTPNHDGLLFADYPTNCLGCHNDMANEVAASTHYKWVGDTPDMVNQPGTQQGKLTNAVNSYCINILGDWGICGKCHVGRGLPPNDPAADNSNIDCLMCHNEQYARARTRIGIGPGSMTVPTPDDCMVQEVHRPTKANCLKCHAYAGGGNAVKRGDLAMADASVPVGQDNNSDPSFDVHMNTSGANLDCTSCHAFINHKTIGKGSDLRPTDDPTRGSEVSCVTCHAGKDTPTGHSSAGRTEANSHVARVACQACHIPVYAKVATETHRDWRTHHDSTDASTCDANNPCPGHPHTDKAANLTPTHKFWDRTSDNYLLGDDASLTYDAALNTYPTSRPMPNDGDGANHAPGASKLHAFKYKTATQPKTIGDNRLVALNTFIYLHPIQTGSSIEAIESGLVNQGYQASEPYEWVDTDTYQMLNHGVSPARDVDCAVCHGNLAYDPQNPSELDAEGYMLKDDPALTCAQCHREKNFKRDQASMHNHVGGKDLDCYFCHTFSRKAERNESAWCHPCENGPGECADPNGNLLDGPVTYNHTCPGP